MRGQLAFGCSVLALAAFAPIPTATSKDVPVVLRNQTWHCTSPQSATVVNVVIDNKQHIDGAHLDAGCTGSIVVNITTNGADGIKVHGGAHDLTITGSITCIDKKDVLHQDGVQAMGGQRVLLGSTQVPNALVINCPTGNNGGLFINAGLGSATDPASWPTDIVADHAEIYERNAPVNIGPHSVRSGVRNSVLHHGDSPASPDDCVRTDPQAQSPVNENNVCAN
jgi:hypothetical protein